MKNDEVNVLLSDHSKDAENIVNRLKKLKLFNSIELLKSKDLIYSRHNKMEMLLETIQGIWGNSKICRCINPNIEYDELLYYNLDICTVTIFSYLYSLNNAIKCSRIEEGIIAYFSPQVYYKNYLCKGRTKLVLIGRKMMKKPTVNSGINSFYCFFPDSYKGELKTIQIPLIQLDNEYLKKCLATIFDVNLNELKYPQKYIYFAGVGDIEGGEPIGEIRLAKKIAEIVGKDNLLIKTHPRDASQMFEKEGFQIDHNSSIPWEVIQLNYDFSKHIFLTALSGSVLSINMIIKKRPKTLFLYTLCNLENNIVGQKSKNIINKLFRDSNSNIENIYFISNIEEMEKLI